MQVESPGNCGLAWAAGLAGQVLAFLQIAVVALVGEYGHVADASAAAQATCL